MNLVLMCILFAIGANLLAFLLWTCVRRLFSMEVRLETNSVASSYFSTIGTIYAVILGFMLFDVWNDFQDAARNVELEASSLGQIVRLADRFPPAVKTNVRQAVREYAAATIDPGGSAMQNGMDSPEDVASYNRLWDVMSGIKAADGREILFHDHMLSAATEFAKYRRLREFKARASLPSILWIVLWTGGLITIGFSCLFGVESGRMHLVKILCLTTMVSIVMFAIWEIYGPFEGLVVVRPDAFQMLLQQLLAGGV
jgi:hypothetical protein